jgi:DNA-binding SARP family transcriptional activator/tetratricopeptide (TPR) repeat protein
VRFGVLGPVEIYKADGQVLALPRRQERCVLAILLLEAGRSVSVDRLCDLLWNDNPPLRPQQVIRSYISRIRAVLARAATDDVAVELTAHNGGYLLKVDPDTVDLHRFRRLHNQAGATTDPHVRDRLLRDALALWRGPALAKAATGRLRQRLCADLDEQHLQTIEEALATGLELGRHHDLLPDLARLTTEHPTRQRLVELHMIALHRDGRSTDASRAYHDLRARLTVELGLDPDPEVEQLHQAILRGEQVGAPPARTAARSADAPLLPAVLPADPAAFAGRSQHLNQLDTLLTRRTSAIVISAIAGTAGVGKTALAVHWAHRVRHRFPDGQLYLNLRGFDPTGAVMATAEAVRRFLDALQVPTQRIPASLDAQIDLYRSLLADKAMLVVLDNARDSAQVRPLLPGAPSCLVVVTSRNQLTSLIAETGAHPVTLDLLTYDEAQQLLAHRLGTARIAAEPDAVDEIIAGCARLPLALTLVAAHASLSPDAGLDALAKELRDTQHRWQALTGDDPSTDVRSVFSWSYQALTPGAARLFRLLGLHPGPDISAPAAASLAGTSPDEVMLALAELAMANLIVEHTPGRYILHDLLRTYAADMTHTHDSPDHRDAAVHRVLDHYLHTAHRAALLLAPRRDPIVPPQPKPGVRPESLAEDGPAALAWFTAEHHTLLAAIHAAAGAGLDVHTWQLAWTMADYLDRRGHWRDKLAVQHIALESARRLADQPTEALIHHGLAVTYDRQGNVDDARNHFQQALALRQEHGDLIGQANSHRGLAVVWERQNHPEKALQHAQQCLHLSGAAGHRAGEARALNSVGWYHALVGDYRHAVRLCQQALLMFQELEDRFGAAAALDSLGYVHHKLGQHQQAADYYQHALDLCQHTGDKLYEAEALTHLGDTHDSAGNVEGARDAWHRALAILAALDHPNKEAVRAKLHLRPPPQ